MSLGELGGMKVKVGTEVGEWGSVDQRKRLDGGMGDDDRYEKGDKNGNKSEVERDFRGAYEGGVDAKEERERG